MKRLCVRTMAIAALMAVLFGCEEDPAAPAEAQVPPAVAPLEVTPSGETAADEEDIEALRARIAELEAQVGETEAATPEAESGTQTATVPEGVEVPGQEADPATGEETEEASTATPPATRRRAQDRGLLGALLGDDAPTTRRRSSGGRAEGEEEDTPLGLPDPSRILLGD